MTPDLEAVRANRPVVISVVVAAIAVTACALVAIALMLGWVGPRAPTSSALPEGAALSPGESVVPAPGNPVKPAPERTAPEGTSPSRTAPSRAAPSRPDYRTPPPPDPRRSGQ